MPTNAQSYPKSPSRLLLSQSQVRLYILHITSKNSAVQSVYELPRIDRVGGNTCRKTPLYYSAVAAKSKDKFNPLNTGCFIFVAIRAVSSIQKWSADWLKSAVSIRHYWFQTIWNARGLSLSQSIQRWPVRFRDAAIARPTSIAEAKHGTVLASNYVRTMRAWMLCGGFSCQ